MNAFAADQAGGGQIVNNFGGVTINNRTDADYLFRQLMGIEDGVLATVSTSDQPGAS